MLRNILKNFAKHRYGFTLFAFLLAASLTGVTCVLFMRSFEYVLNHRLDFNSIGGWCWLTTPVLFLASVEFILRTAPCASGTGIPQTIFAAKHITVATEPNLLPLLSPLTLIVKVLGLLAAVWVGASTGREGPTVHVAACVFFGIMLLIRRLTGLNFDLRSVVIAGGAAGLGAAFNTPLAGVTFAIEELTTDYFSSIKDFVLIAIIIAAISAKVLTGEYTYFGKLSESPSVSLFVTLVIGLTSGMLGSFFSSAILWGQKKLTLFRGTAYRYFIPIGLSFLLLLIAFFFGTRVLGPGNQVAQNLLQNQFGNWTFTFPLAKMIATLLTYWSGIAGGIFAPCLSIGAALGSDIGYFMGASLPSCALIGMAAFLSATIQAPITSFVIIYEMTGHHQMLLPVMLASLIGFMTARVLGAEHLYQTLSKNYDYLLGTDNRGSLR